MNYFRILLLIGFVILLVINCFNFFINNEIGYWGICSNVLMAIAMMSEIRKYQQDKNSNHSQL